jgi:tetratricopeptide (TPR) repeat protein
VSHSTAVAALSIAQVLAHCGGSPAAAVHHLASAIASDPSAPEPYEALAELRRDRPAEFAEAVGNDGSLSAVLARSYAGFLDGDMDTAAMALGSVTGARPGVPWADAPWFADDHFLTAVSPDALAEAVMRTTDYGHPLDSEAVRSHLGGWFHAVETVTARRPEPEAMARMAIFLRACGLTEASFDLCDRADRIEPVMLTEVVRAGTWRRLGDLGQTGAAFERALALDPANWSLHLDLADLRAEQGDFAAAVAHAAEGLGHEPSEITLRAAHAAYRVRLTGSPDAVAEFVELAPGLPNPGYRDILIDRACAGPGLPSHRVRELRSLGNG